MCLFSVITVSYNSEKFISQTMESVLSQRYEDFEYLIGDDGSSDNSWNIISGFTDSRIKKYQNEKNIGEYANRNRAVQEASGAYIIFIDGDDIIYPHALEIIASYIKQFPECAMLFMREWDDKILYPFKADPQTIYRFEFLDKSIVGGNFTNVVFKTAVLKAFPFPGNIRSGDTYIQLKLAQQFPALLIPAGLTWWRRRTGNATEKLFKDYRYMAEIINYRFALLEEGNPLTEHETTMAKKYMYGRYLRQLARLFFNGKWSEFAFLTRSIPVPFKYYSAIFSPSRENVFEYITGDAPLHTRL